MRKISFLAFSEKLVYPPVAQWGKKWVWKIILLWKLVEIIGSILFIRSILFKNLGHKMSGFYLDEWFYTRNSAKHLIFVSINNVLWFKSWMKRDSFFAKNALKVDLFLHYQRSKKKFFFSSKKRDLALVIYKPPKALGNCIIAFDAAIFAPS